MRDLWRPGILSVTWNHPPPPAGAVCQGQAAEHGGIAALEPDGEAVEVRLAVSAGPGVKPLALVRAVRRARRWFRSKPLRQALRPRTPSALESHGIREQGRRLSVHASGCTDPAVQSREFSGAAVERYPAVHPGKPRSLPSTCRNAVDGDKLS